MKPGRASIRDNHRGLEHRGRCLAGESGKLHFKILPASSFPGQAELSGASFQTWGRSSQDVGSRVSVLQAGGMGAQGPGRESGGL